MKYPVRLFLGDMEVEFSTPPDILFNYSETELTNPTIIKNAYSKTITIEGTKTNNQIFGHIYDMQRIQGYNGSVMGSAFNPLVKTDFTLFYNGFIYESGYFKLDEVRRNNNNIEYDISLFGGLGDYFYNLSFREDGTPMELSDLKYEWEVNNDSELGFQINKEAVNEAWINLLQPSSKWDTINFAPCYNGIPSNISADKFLICNGVYPFLDSASGYSVGTSQHEHTEWETFDLRSYLQRPVLRVREVLKACADPRNNGGYTVNFDNDFFKSDNPYYQDSWITLPMLTDLDIPATDSSALTISAITYESNIVLYRLWDGGANATNVQVDVNVNFTPSGSYSGDSVYLYRDYEANGGVTLQSRFVKSFQADSSILVQMLGYNESGQIGAVSNVYRLVSPPEGEYSVDTMPDWMRRMFETAIPATSINGINNVIGKFTKKNGQFVFTDLDGNTQTLRFTFPSDAVFTKLKMKILPQYAFSMKRTFTGGSSGGHGWTELDYWSSRYQYSDSWQDESLVKNLDKVNGSLSYSPVGATGTTTSFEGFFSNRTYSKRDLLTLGVSPAQFLLSYAKAFGLYFIKDVEKKEITILSRHNFYKRNEIVNINDLIDKGSDIKIIPNSPKYQYYDFAFEQVDSEAAEAYKKTYGNEYGTATVNTGYQYEKEHKALLDGNVFKGGVTVMEKNKYFFKPIQGTPQLIWNGFSYTYVNGQGQNVEEKINPEPMHGTIINPDGLKYYDYMAKLQFHNANNEASDGSMVLVFCDNVISGAESCGYKLTDDVPEMYTLNDGQPCWLLVSGTTDASGNTIAVVPNRIPHFTRDIYNYQHYIENSLDMGTPLTTYVPNGFVSDWQSIYSKSWKSYISDLYDVNTRVLRCRCLLRERPNPDWMRRFYWFDNSYWRLNEIKDWDISSFGTTEMEFIKVQDINNYDSVQYSNCPIVEDRFEQHFISYTGGTITGIIYVSDGSGLAIGQDGVPVRYSDGTEETWNPQGIVDPIYPSGAINVEVTLTIPANTSIYARTITLPIEDACDNFHYIAITQESAWSGATISPTSLSFADSGGTGTLTISSPSGATWTLDCISGDTSWITMSVVSSSATQTIYSVTAGANTGTTRNLIYEFESNGYVTNVMISQTANSEAYITPTSLSFEASGGTLNVHVSDPTNHGWTLVPSDSWINPAYTAYTGDAIFAITATTNSGAARNATLTFRDNTKTGTTTVTVSQASGVLDYFMFDVIRTTGGAAGIYYKKQSSATPTRTIYYSKDGGATWTSLNPSTGNASYIPVAPGDKVFVKGNSNNYSGCYFTNHVSADTTYSYYDISGNILSLVYGDDFSGQTSTTSNIYFGRLFRGDSSANGGVVNANMLKLPTNVSESCYKQMFEWCTKLVSAPALPATTMAESCYEYMFSGCTSLTAAPELPSTELADYCYRGMFIGCTSLTSAPVLPATTLASTCYSGMFEKCTSLTTAPTLPATTLVDGCYSLMFFGCSSLNYIKCLATDISASLCTSTWVYGVASSGTFVKDADMNDWAINSNSGVPINWTVVNDGPSWNCYLTFFYGNVTFPQSGMWDNYTIYYDPNSATHPVETGNVMVMFDGGIIVQQGDIWDPTSAMGWTVYSPFTEKTSLYSLNVPESLKNSTIYLQVEFGSADIGTVMLSTVVTVNIPQNGGSVLVAMPAMP